MRPSRIGLVVKLDTARSSRFQPFMRAYGGVGDGLLADLFGNPVLDDKPITRIMIITGCDGLTAKIDIPKWLSWRGMGQNGSVLGH